MGLKHNIYLESPRVYGCAQCDTHLTSVEVLISKVRLR